MGSLGTQNIVYMFREMYTKCLVFTVFGRDKQWMETFMEHAHTLTHSLTQMDAYTLQHTHTNSSILIMFHRKAVLPHFPLQT